MTEIITNARSGLIMVLLWISAASAYARTVQDILEREVSCSMNKAPLKNVLLVIEANAQVKFVYSPDQIDLKKVVSIEATNRKLKDVLAELLTPLGIQFLAQQNNYIILQPLRTTGQVDVQGYEPLATMVLPVPIEGKVTDNHGNPLPGTSVIIKGTTTGTTANGEGFFTINAQPEDVLVFSFIGFETLEVKVYAQTLINVTLVENINNLDEVLIIGYGTTTKIENTGSVGKVTGDEIRKQPVSNPLQAMQGRVPGVVITQQSGVPGSAMAVNIRGKNSLRVDGNNPLYIIDGVPYTATSLSTAVISQSITLGGNPLSNINPADIESIEVLKDADATAIYGSRGANGVVLITTRKGEKGKTQFDVNLQTGFGQVATKMEILNTQQYIDMRHQAFQNDEITPTTGNARDLMMWDTTRYTDWEKELIGNTSFQQDVQANISGGNDYTQFLVGGAWHNESTVYPGEFRYRKGSSHLNINHQSRDDRFFMTVLASYTRENNDMPSMDYTGQTLALAPNTPEPFDDDGELNWGPPGATWSNPYGSLLREYTMKTDNLVGNTQLAYEVIKGLKVKASIGLNMLIQNEMSTWPKESFNPAFGPVAFMYTGNHSSRTWIAEPQTEYKKKWTNLNLEVLVGATWQENVRDDESYYAEGFSHDAFLGNLAAASYLLPFNHQYAEYRYQALFSRVHLDWKKKYFINLTTRRDGSTRFGPDNQYATFGAVGAAWIFSNETAVRNTVPFLSLGKIRASLGSTGNDQIGDYQYLDAWTPTSYTYEGTSGLRSARLFNAAFGWETTRKLEAATELGFWEDRLQASAAWYRNVSDNQLVGYPLPMTTGFSSVQQNLNAKILNTGWEFLLTSQNVSKEHFTWTTSLNWTIPRSELLGYPGLESSSLANQYVVGESMDIQQRYHLLGVDQQTGVYKFEDVNGNGYTDYPGDLLARKAVTQKGYGAITNTFAYKNWKLDFMIQVVNQTGWNYFAVNTRIPGQMGNQPAFIRDQWQEPGDNATVQKFTQTYGDAGYAYFDLMQSDGTISNASFARLKTASLTWDVPLKANAGLQVYLLGQNLFTITNYLGRDPETQNHLSLPPLRVVSLGASIKL